MKDVDITASYPLFILNGGELLDEEATESTTSRFMASCIGYEPTPFGGVQGVVDVVTGGASPF